MKIKCQLNFNLILDVLTEKQGYTKIRRLLII